MTRTATTLAALAALALIACSQPDDVVQLPVSA